MIAILGALAAIFINVARVVLAGGMIATAAAGCCAVYAQAQTLPIDAQFTNALQGAQRFDVYPLSQDDLRTLDLGQLGARPSRPVLDAARVAGIKAILLDPAVYSPGPEIQKACPFWPTMAIAFASPNGRQWLLISPGCQTARYVQEGADWRRQLTLNLTADATSRLNGLLQ